ncbi:MAG: ABC transporter ATP-binding protein [Saprospiraceae bacterium]|nr:ABC transporter ATP-binding protein [Saprospiraceae bacterium]
MITLKNITKRYRTDTIETTALDNIQLHIQKGEFVSVMGPSGCGKSTLLNIIGLIDDPTEGEIVIDNQRIHNYHSSQIARFRNEKLGFVFQSFHLIPELNVLDNVELPLLYRPINSSERKSKAKIALEAVGLSGRLEHFPSQLSGGQKQRVAIARAIVGNPAVILADEPTGNLDSIMGNEIMNILLTLNREQKTTIIMVTHDENMAHKTDRLIRLYDGRQL